jgi:Sulfatase-modifying factor enzyme 1
VRDLGDYAFCSGSAGCTYWPTSDSFLLLIGPVGRKLPNSWGLHDMHGNAWEWCLEPCPKTQWPEIARLNGEANLRGGSVASSPAFCRSAARYSDEFGPLKAFGFRPVFTLFPRTE